MIRRIARDFWRALEGGMAKSTLFLVLNRRRKPPNVWQNITIANDSCCDSAPSRWKKGAACNLLVLPFVRTILLIYLYSGQDDLDCTEKPMEAGIWMGAAMGLLSQEGLREGSGLIDFALALVASGSKTFPSRHCFLFCVFFKETLLFSASYICGRSTALIADPCKPSTSPTDLVCQLHNTPVHV